MESRARRALASSANEFEYRSVRAPREVLEGHTIHMVGVVAQSRGRSLKEGQAPLLIVSGTFRFDEEVVPQLARHSDRFT